MAGRQECRWSSWLTGSVVLLDWGQVDQEQGMEYFICTNTMSEGCLEGAKHWRCCKLAVSSLCLSLIFTSNQATAQRLVGCV